MTLGGLSDANWALSSPLREACDGAMSNTGEESEKYGQTYVQGGSTIRFKKAFLKLKDIVPNNCR